VCIGASSVSRLEFSKGGELSDYFSGFFKSLSGGSASTVQLFKLSLKDNFKLIAVLWLTGLLVISFPLFYLVIPLKGFVTGFSSGLVLSSLGLKGIAISLFCFLPKEIIIVPCLIAIAVNGINFSKTVLKGQLKKGYRRENSYIKRLLPFCFVNGFFAVFILLGVVWDSLVSPVILRFF
jgi:stage II sporulation protein M